MQSLTTVDIINQGLFNNQLTLKSWKWAWGRGYILETGHTIIHGLLVLHFITVYNDEIEYMRYGSVGQ